MDLLDDFRDECDVSIQELKASEIHQQAGLKRIEIAEDIIKTWNKQGGDLREVMYSVIEQHKDWGNDNVEVRINDDLVPLKDFKVEVDEVKFANYENSEKAHKKFTEELIKNAPRLSPKEAFPKEPEIEKEIDPDDLPF